MYRLVALNGNSQKLDGGAMFGNVPKALWTRWITPDDHNRITLACRALLVQDGKRTILLETGIGAFFEPTLRERYGVEESQHVLLDSLHHAGLTEHDIDFVILSHLHFDHAGGLLSAWQAQQPSTLLFPNAQYVISKTGWERACHPHVRDKASFIPTLNALLAHSDRLILIDQESCEILGPDFRFLFTHGHTPGLMHTCITLPNHHSPLIFASDLIPGTHWIHLPISMGYDRSPELLIDEKKALLELAIQQQAYVFYTHDPLIAMSRIAKDPQGKFIPIDSVQAVSASLELAT